MATNRSLRALREQILISYAYDVIDSDEYVLLYDANQSKDTYPYWNYQPFDIGMIDDEQCFIDFRFAKNDLNILLDVLNVPERIVTFPCRYSDMTPIFDRNPTEICLIYNKLISKIYDDHSYRLHSWNQPLLAPQQLTLYDYAIHARGAHLDSCFGFVDGTVLRIARPKQNQRQVYNGHKWVHALMIGNLTGPYEGRRHDSFMLADSGLLQQLQQHAWHNQQPLCIHGDPAYPLSVHLQSPFRGANLNPLEQRYNQAMSSVRVSVE